MKKPNVLKEALKVIPIVGSLISHRDSQTDYGSLDKSGLWGELIRLIIALLTTYNILS